MIETPPSRRIETAFWIAVLVLFLLTRLPAMSQYFTVDNVNLALSLEKFDPRIHQPQPPGYPLFVALNRVVNIVFHNAARTFELTGLAAIALCLPLTFAIGRRMFGDWVGRAAVLLLLVTPPFWYASLDGALRPHLALFSLLTAWCCWRCWNGEKAYAIWGAIAVGVGAGFRPDLGGYLFPLWLLSAWMGTRSVGAVLRGLVVMAAVVFAWLGGMAVAVGGFGELYKLNVDYLVDQSKRQSVMLGAVEKAWLRQISRLVIWNGTAVLGALWAIPIFVRARERVGLLSSQSIFIITWLLPGLLFQALVHVEDPGHTLFSVPALAIVAAYLIFIGTQRFAELREVFVAGAVVVNCILFLGLFSLPAAGAPVGGLNSLKNSFLFGAFETSIGELRYMDNTAIATMKELQQFVPAAAPVIVVTSDVAGANWFMNWRIARYYAPNLDFLVLGDHFVQHVKRDRVDAKVESDLKVPVPQGGRVIWLLERDGPFDRALRQAQPGLPGAAYLAYTDITPGATPFRVMDFEFVPTTH